MRNKVLLFAFSLFVGVTVKAQDFRAPAYPLVTVDPYFSIWSFTDQLNGSPTVHWTGKVNALQGIIRVDGKAYYFMGQPIPKYKQVLPLARENEDSWRYTQSKPDNGWTSLNYDASHWETAKGDFSDSKEGNAHWSSHDIWVRRTFDLDKADSRKLLLKTQHDDGITAYINGVLACRDGGANGDPDLVTINKEALATLKKGQNVLAIHCENTGGLAYLDAGLVEALPFRLKIPKAKQTNVKVTATQTRYGFKVGGVALDIKFTAPLLPKQLKLLSRPANYLTFKTHAVDGKQHKVQIYFSAGGDLAVNKPEQQVNWNRDKTENLKLMRVGTSSQNILGRKGDDVRIDWGHFYLAVPENNTSTTAMAASEVSIKDFVKNGKLTIKDDKKSPRAAGQDPVSLAVSYDLGNIDATPKKRHLILAYDQIYSIAYFHQWLQPWWRKEGMTFHQMLWNAERDYHGLIRKCDQFDKQLHQDMVDAGGEKYAAICELAYRQSIAAHKLVEGPKGIPLFLSKENFSNGSIGTVDITYPSSPLYLYYNPDLLKGMMIPILYYSESGRYDHPYAAHDVGTFPIANGQTYGEPMPVEESGNMLVLSAAITKADGNASFVKKHWKQLTIWAHYLKDNGLDPKNQLCTDDFAGHLAHNANLSIKAIMGLASYGYMAKQLGKEATGEKYIQLARDYARQWMKMDADGDHYSLTFDKKGTWSQKYNLVWDKILQLGIFPDEVTNKELKYYLTKQTKYGLPLDSRATYTKADWILWTATLADDKNTFHALMDPVFTYINETPTRVPLSDWYQTTDAAQVGFQARSVVGAFFIKALNEKWNGEDKK